MRTWRICQSYQNARKLFKCIQRIRGKNLYEHGEDTNEIVYVVYRTTKEVASAVSGIAGRRAVSLQ
jgi:hypothetical protein